MIKISIIIPCYNVEKYIQRCINSLKKQSCKELEFIFINDGSTDGTLEYILDFAKIDNRVSIIDKRNEGVSSARNDALKIATGEYIFFLDSDDFLEYESCAEMYSLITKNRADCLIFKKHKFIYPTDKEVVYNWPFAEGVYDIDNFLKKVPFLPITPKLYKNQIIQKYNIGFDIDLVFGEVFTFFVHFLKYAHRIKVTDSFIYNYTMRHNSATHKIDYTKDIQILRTLNTLNAYTKDVPSIDKARCYNKSVVKLAFSFTFAKYVKNGIYNRNAISILRKLKNNIVFRTRLYDVAFHNIGTKDQLISFSFLISTRLSLILLSILHNLGTYLDTKRTI